MRQAFCTAETWSVAFDPTLRDLLFAFDALFGSTIA